MWDKLIKHDGKVDSKLQHITYMGMFIFGGVLLINILGGLGIILSIPLSIYAGLKTYEADVRINGGGDA